jgi:host factor-I protein
MQPHNSHPQNEFLNTLRKERKRLEVYLVNGIRLTGIIESFDQFLVTLRTPGGMQGIYKQAISTIQLDTGHRPAPRAPREDGGRDGLRGNVRDGGHDGARDGVREAPRYERPQRPARDASTDAPPVVVTRKRRALVGHTPQHTPEHTDKAPVTTPEQD